MVYVYSLDHSCRLYCVFYHLCSFVSFFFHFLGFRWDRQWMVVNSKRRAFTQRGEPKLALVEVELPVEAFSDGWEPDEGSFLGKQVFIFILMQII